MCSLGRGLRSLSALVIINLVDGVLFSYEYDNTLCYIKMNITYTFVLDGFYLLSCELILISHPFSVHVERSDF